jgi:hypothetical protein
MYEIPFANLLVFLVRLKGELSSFYTSRSTRWQKYSPIAIASADFYSSVCYQFFAEMREVEMNSREQMKSQNANATTHQHWVTVNRAAEVTGLPSSFMHERTSRSARVWPEGVVWKWFDGRKLIELNAFMDLVHRTRSAPTNRGCHPPKVQ